MKINVPNANLIILESLAESAPARLARIVFIMSPPRSASVMKD